MKKAQLSNILTDIGAVKRRQSPDPGFSNLINYFFPSDDFGKYNNVLFERDIK